MIKMSISQVMGGHKQKPIGVLNLARIGEDAKSKNLKIGEVWKELEKLCKYVEIESG
jgi:hypothetical protein